MGLFDLFRRKPAQRKEVNKDIAAISQEETDIIWQLETLGYFKYAPEEDHLQLKMEIAESLAERRYFPFVIEEFPPFGKKDPRHFILDNEELYEQGGFTAALKDMQPLFDKMNIKMEVSDHEEQWDAVNKWLNHRITLNGKKYVIFDRFRDQAWLEAAQRFADMVNDQLALQQSDERLYLISDGHDGRAVFLTAPLLDLLDGLVEGEHEKPLKMEEWCEHNHIARVNVC